MEKNLLKEVYKMTIGVFLLSIVMVVIFAVFGYFDMSVVWGAILGSAGCILNYFLLAFSISRVVNKDGAVKGFMGMSYILRMIFIALVIILAIKLPYINYIAAAIPFVFPRIVISVLNAKLDKKSSKEGGDKI